MVVLDLDLSLVKNSNKTSLNGKKGLIIYSGQSRFFDECIELQSKATENFKRYTGLIDKNFKLDIMLSTWKEDTPEDYMDSLNKWTHGEVFSRLIENNVFDELIKYNPNIKNYNGVRAMLGKIHALCHVFDLPSHYDFFILTRTDYHVPCIDINDAKFLNTRMNDACDNITSLFSAGHFFKVDRWSIMIDDNYAIVPPDLIYPLDRNNTENVGLSVMRAIVEEQEFSAHVILLKFLSELQKACHAYYSETDIEKKITFQKKNALRFLTYHKPVKFIRSLEVLNALLLDYSDETWFGTTAGKSKGSNYPYRIIKKTE
jgi:hypothetical protein